jgi:hypothetical protein
MVGHAGNGRCTAVLHLSHEPPSFGSQLIKILLRVAWSSTSLDVFCSVSALASRQAELITYKQICIFCDHHQ